MTTARERALDLLAANVLVDGHNDLPWALRTLGGDDPEVDLGRFDIARGLPELHTDLARLRAGRVGAQFWSVYVPCSFTGAAAVEAVRQQVALVKRMVERYPEHLRLADTAAEAEAAFANGLIASLVGAEGGHGIGGSLEHLRHLRQAGVRYLTLTHNLNSEWADSATDTPVHGGLSPFGREVVREMNRIGMLVDLSHVAPTTMRDALATTTRPVVFSHSSCRAVTDHPRNVPDDVLAALPGNGGVCMLTFVPYFVSTAARDWDAAVAADMTAAGLDPRDLEAEHVFLSGRSGPPCPPATVADVVAHLEHAREVAGIDHVGIGGDFDGTPHLPVGLEDVSTYPTLFAALLDRGWSGADCAKLAGRNVLRVLRAADE